jgi:hypothetical protein
VILATQRVLEQQALELWRLQMEARIEQMMRESIPLGAVAAALTSPETSERIALFETATAGGISALEAARLNARRAGRDLALLDGLRAGSISGVNGEEPAASASPLPLSELDELVPLASAIGVSANGMVKS